MMAEATDPASVGRGIVDASPYMTLGTADGDGRPWASPVWFAHDAYRDFIWVSAPEARHSRNIAARPEVGIVIFDSTQAPGTGAGVYLEALAAEVPGAELDDALRVFSERSVAQGDAPWSADDVRPPARHRMYRATATAAYLLGALDERIPVPLAAR
jgi:hypothetical protein